MTGGNPVIVMKTEDPPPSSSQGVIVFENFQTVNARCMLYFWAETVFLSLLAINQKTGVNSV